MGRPPPQAHPSLVTRHREADEAGMRPPARSPALERGEAGLAQATRGHFAFADASEDKWAPSRSWHLLLCPRDGWDRTIGRTNTELMHHDGAVVEKDTAPARSRKDRLPRVHHSQIPSAPAISSG